MTDMSSSKNQTDMTFIMKHGIYESCDIQTHKKSVVVLMRKKNK